MPFSIVGSNTLLEVNGKRVRGRLYPWGVVEVENKDHCDFVKLRNMLIRLVIEPVTVYYPRILGIWVVIASNCCVISPGHTCKT